MLVHHVHQTVNGEKSMFHGKDPSCLYEPKIGLALGQTEYIHSGKCTVVHHVIMHSKKAQFHENIMAITGCYHCCAYLTERRLSHNNRLC